MRAGRKALQPFNTSGIREEMNSPYRLTYINPQGRLRGLSFSAASVDEAVAWSEIFELVSEQPVLTLKKETRNAPASL